MNFCKYGAYRLKQGLGYSKRVVCWDQLTAKYSIPQIKEFLKTKAIVINPCGRCDYCLSIKKNQYKKRVKSQLSKSRYNYLMTITFDNDLIDSLITDEQRNKLLSHNISISHLSNLSKSTISNIIRNLKKKFDTYYKRKVSFHYFLCGEYGENTLRAHYHILLMLDVPIPNLKKQAVKGNHFKSDFIDSSQFSMYDIEPANFSANTAGYISKYLSKSQDYNKGNYNRFHDEQIKYYVSNGIDPHGATLINKPEDVKYLLAFWLLSGDMFELYVKNFNFNLIKCRECRQQRPFIKISRGLGMCSVPLDNFKNGVINNYYYDKYRTEKERKNCKGIETPDLDHVIDLYDKERIHNISEYFYKSKRGPKNNEKIRKDIF